MKTPDEIKMSMKRCHDISFCLENCSYRKLDFPECIIAMRDDILPYIQQLEDKVEELNRVRADLTATNMELRDAVFKQELHKRRLEEERSAFEAQVPRWISVEERLPERGITKCSACVKCGDGLKRVVCASYNAELKLWTGWHGEKIGNEITHWMPLPEPPKEDD